MIKELIPLSIKKKLKLLALKGENVYCPCCKSGFITFLPKKGIGQKIRLNAICPKCNSLERDRLMIKYLYERTNLFKDKVRFLHVSPEMSIYNTFLKSDNIEYFPVDKFAEGYSYPKETIEMDITQIKYDDNYFDVIICSNVLEHIPEDSKAMAELLRVLKPTGWAIIQVPIDESRDITYEDFTITDPKKREIAFGWPDHVRWYGKDFINRLEEVGFNVSVDKFIDRFNEEEIFKYGFMLKDYIYLCTKNVNSKIKNNPKINMPEKRQYGGKN